MILILVFLGSIFNLVNTLQCINNCKMIYSMNQSFVLPSNCSYISSDRCSVNILFWYEQGQYVVTFPGDLSYDDNLDDNRHFIMIETVNNTFFSYDINHICRDKDDCAVYYAQMKISEMSKRFYNIPNLYFDLKRILYKNIHTDDDLLCFDTNEAIRQCLLSGMSGSCQIMDDLSKHRIYRRSCQHHTHQSANVNIYDSGSFAMMTIKCNRNLCNGPVTIEAVKHVLNHYGITDKHGRLSGISSHMSFDYYLVLLLLLFSFQGFY